MSAKKKIVKAVKAAVETVVKAVKCDALNVGHRRCKCPDCLRARGE